MAAESPNSMIGLLIAYFDDMLPLTDEERQLLTSKFQSRLYRRRQFVLHNQH